MTESKLLIDSSAWLAYLLAADEEVKKVIEQEVILLSSFITLFEIRRKLLREKTAAEKIEKTISFITSRSITIELTKETAEAAASISVEKKLSAMDALIYTTAQKNHAILVTGDYDFKGCEDVLFIY